MIALQQVLLAGRRVLRDDRTGGRHQGADPDAGDEAHQPERRRGRRQRRHAHADGEPGVGGEHHLAAADDVAHAARQQSPDEHADQRVAAQRPGHRRSHRAELARITQERRHDRAVDHQIVATDDGADEAEGGDPGDRPPPPGILLGRSRLSGRGRADSPVPGRGTDPRSVRRPGRPRRGRAGGRWRVARRLAHNLAGVGGAAFGCQ